MQLSVNTNIINLKATLSVTLSHQSAEQIWMNFGREIYWSRWQNLVEYIFRTILLKQIEYYHQKYKHTLNPTQNQSTLSITAKEPKY